MHCAIYNKKNQSQQHLGFPCSLLSRYYPGASLLNFSDLMRTGAFKLLWPLAPISLSGSDVLNYWKLLESICNHSLYEVEGERTARRDSHSLDNFRIFQKSKVSINSVISVARNMLIEFGSFNWWSICNCLNNVDAIVFKRVEIVVGTHLHVKKPHTGARKVLKVVLGTHLHFDRVKEWSQNIPATFAKRNPTHFVKYFHNIGLHTLHFDWVGECSQNIPATFAKRNQHIL